MTFTYDHNQSLGYLTGVSSRLFSNILAMRFREAGIDMTAEQWGAIIVLLNGEAMNQAQLGELLYLEKSSVSRLTDGLERRGWIVRTQDPKDCRQKLIIPTSMALDMAEHCTTIARTVLEQAQLGMTEDEMIDCRSSLSRIITNLREQAG